MNLAQFLAESQADLIRFVVMWLEKQATPEAAQYPMELPPGDWEEQFRAFVGWDE